MCLLGLLYFWGYWPTFGEEPSAKFAKKKFTLAFPMLFSKTTGWLTTKLDRGDLFPVLLRDLYYAEPKHCKDQPFFK